VKTADRYLARELLAPFLVGVFGFLLMQVSAVLMNLFHLLLDDRAAMAQVARVIVYHLPQFIVYALPVAVLFGVSLGVNRMARENEITVMRLSGMPIKRILLPLAGVSALISVASFYINETIAPSMNHRAAMAEYRLFFKVRPVAIRSDVFFGSGPYKFYIGDMQKTRDSADPSDISFLLTRVMVYELRSGTYPVLYTAESATAKGTRWTLYHGTRHEMDEHGFTTNEAAFPKYTFDVDRTVGTLWTMAQTSDEMNAMQLSRAIAEGAKVGNPDTREWRVDYYLKFALPFACVVLTVISLPLAVHFGHGGGFVGILIALCLFFLYVQAYLVFKELGGSVLPPVVAAWLPNAVFTCVGVFLIWREE
jgi:LPS export ABC transporter permease LptG